MRSFGFGLGNRRVGGSSYNPNAQLVFDAVGDVPEVVKPFYSDLFQSWDDAGVFSNANFWAILCVPSLNAFNTLIEVKSLTIQSSFFDTGALAIPYNSALQAIPSFAGYSFRTNGYIKTGYIPSVKMTLNNSSEFAVFYASETNANTYNYGAFNGISQSTVFTKNLNTGNLIADAYASVSGRVTFANNSAAGVYITNRRATNYMSVVKNGVVAGSVATNAGSLPTVEVYLNSFNNAGTVSTRRNQSAIGAYGSFGSGLTAQQETDLSTALMTWQTSMERISTAPTKQIILDSNSHGTYWLGATLRKIEYETIVSGWRYSNFSVSGQQTSQMQSDYAAQIAPLYNAGYTKNILIFNEVTNDLWFNGDLANAKVRAAAYIAAAQATGFEVITSPIMCRKFTSNPGGRTETQFNNDINDYNTWVLAGSSGADVVLPINPNTFVAKGAMSDAAYNAACAAIYTNATYFYDAGTIGTHLTEAAYFDWGQQFVDAINSL